MFARLAQVSKSAGDLAAAVVEEGGVSCSGLGLGMAGSLLKVGLEEDSRQVAIVLHMAAVVGRTIGGCEAGIVAGSAVVATLMIQAAPHSLGEL